jgi:hypothetical protein
VVTWKIFDTPDNNPGSLSVDPKSIRADGRHPI